MPLIQITANNKSYLVNPAHVTHVEFFAGDPRKSANIVIHLSGTDHAGNGCSLMFSGNEAMQINSNLIAAMS